MKSWDDFCNPQRRNSTWWTIFGDQRGETGWENIVMRHRFLIRTAQKIMRHGWRWLMRPKSVPTKSNKKKNLYSFRSKVFLCASSLPSKKKKKKFCSFKWELFRPRVKNCWELQEKAIGKNGKNYKLTEGPTQHNDRTRPLEREKEKIQRWSSRVPLWLTSHHPRCQPDLNANRRASDPLLLAW